MATVPELKVQADHLGVKYSSKIRKADLERMVSEALAARERAAASRIAPMPNAIREIVYLAQTPARLTPRQARRIRHKGNRAKARV